MVDQDTKKSSQLFKILTEKVPKKKNLVQDALQHKVFGDQYAAN